MKQELVFLILVGSASAALNATWNFQGLTLYITDLGTQLTEDQIDKLADTYFQVYPKERHLYNNMSSAGVRLIFDPNYKDVAMTWGDVVTINPDFVQNHPEDLDFLTHELMHVVQFKKLNNKWKISEVRWLVEGIADYVRDQVGINNEEAGWELPSGYEPGQAYINGYGDTAAFLKFLETKYPGIVKKLFDTQYNDSYTDQTWKTITGKTVDELWQMYVQAGGRKRREIEPGLVDEESRKVFV